MRSVNSYKNLITGIFLPLHFALVILLLLFLLLIIIIMSVPTSLSLSIPFIIYIPSLASLSLFLSLPLLSLSLSLSRLFYLLSSRIISPLSLYNTVFPDIKHAAKKATSSQIRIQSFGATDRRAQKFLLRDTSQGI